MCQEQKHEVQFSSALTTSADTALFPWGKNKKKKKAVQCRKQKKIEGVFTVFRFHVSEATDCLWTTVP